MSVDVTNSPFGSSTFVATITDITTSASETVMLQAPSKRDASAECVVELPPGDIGPSDVHYTQLADFHTVTFTDCQATATQNAGNSLDVDQLPSGSDGAFTVTAFNLGTRTRSKATTTEPVWPNPAWSVNWVSAS
jgi:hypothetical protein